MMAGTIWTKFFWQDWAADPALKCVRLQPRDSGCECFALRQRPTRSATSS